MILKIGRRITPPTRPTISVYTGGQSPGLLYFVVMPQPRSVNRVRSSHRCRCASAAPRSPTGPPSVPVDRMRARYPAPGDWCSAVAAAAISARSRVGRSGHCRRPPPRSHGWPGDTCRPWFCGTMLTGRGRCGAGKLTAASSLGGR